MAYEHAIALADEPYGMPTSRMGSKNAVWLAKMVCASNGMPWGSHTVM